jgi:hypothetical protein
MHALVRKTNTVYCHTTKPSCCRDMRGEYAKPKPPCGRSTTSSSSSSRQIQALAMRAMRSVTLVPPPSMDPARSETAQKRYHMCMGCPSSLGCGITGLLYRDLVYMDLVGAQTEVACKFYPKIEAKNILLQ